MNSHQLALTSQNIHTNTQILTSLDTYIHILVLMKRYILFATNTTCLNKSATAK